MNKYIGNPMQIRGVEEHRLCGGKGDGMRLFQIRNGKGLEITVSADRCADISRLTYKGVNFGYFSPCGYVAPSYYDSVGAGFLKSLPPVFSPRAVLRQWEVHAMITGKNYRFTEAFPIRRLKIFIILMTIILYILKQLSETRRCLLISCS